MRVLYLAVAPARDGCLEGLVNLVKGRGGKFSASSGWRLRVSLMGEGHIGRLVVHGWPAAVLALSKWLLVMRRGLNVV